MAGEKVVVDEKALEKKLDNNEPLTKEEEQFLMENQGAPQDFGGQPGPAMVEEKEEGGEKKEEKSTQEPAENAAEKEAQKAQDALKERAKAVGLTETATEADIQAAEKKKEEEEDAKDPFLKVERLLQKEEKDVTEADLKDYTKREKAYYYQMRKDRKLRQKAEEDRDAARFELSKLKKKDEKPPEEKQEGDKPAEEADDPLKGKDDTDFLTAGDIRKVMAAAKKQTGAAPMNIMALPAVQRFIESSDKEARTLKPDYDDVMELTKEIINTNPAYQKQVAEAFAKGDNPALKMYELIKADPEYANLIPAAQTRVLARKKNSENKDEVKPAVNTKKAQEAAAVEQAIENNDKKPKTSGHAEGKDKLEGTDLTIEQISKMSDREFSKLPKKTRDKYLELYG